MFIIILVSFHFFLLLEALLNYSELISKIDKFHEVLRKISVTFCKMQDGSDANGHALLCAEMLTHAFYKKTIFCDKQFNLL